MDFGRVNAEELDKIDFTLPPDPERNKEMLPGKPAATKFYAGLSKWGREEWLGPLYPTGIKDNEFLKHYVTHFNAIELNATHYRVWKPDAIKKWADMANGRDFKFCPKLYQGVTHRGNLRNKDLVIGEFFRGIETFGEHLGPVLIQLSDTFSPKREDELIEFCNSLPSLYSYAIEFRHQDLIRHEALYEYLTTKHFISVITDVPGRRDAAHMKLTTPKTFIRFACTGSEIDYARITAWAERLKRWKEQGLQEAWFFIHDIDQKEDLPLARFAIEQFNTICDAKLAPLHLKN